MTDYFSEHLLGDTKSSSNVDILQMNREMEQTGNKIKTL